jgi:TonB-dependent starch-binding outer membrane protein SusC
MRKKRLFAGTGVLCPVLLLCLIALLGIPASAQTKVITGKVTDSRDGSPLRGISVVPSGSQRGTTTDDKGEFHITVAPGTRSLLFSSIGFATREVPVEGAVMTVTLTASNISLTDVVVIGYGTAKKKDLTGSIATVGTKDFQTGAITSPDQLIAGKLAGVNVTPNGGSPGSGSTIRIRGLASLSGNNDPLIVIDGLPLSGSGIPGIANDLDLVNPNDIESFTVLKDAAASAIYGSRAASGVIMITTKKGKSGPPQFNFNTALGDQTLAKKESVLNADEFRAYVNANGTAAQKAMLGTANTNWQDLIYRQAIFSSSNISMTGSVGSVMPYRISYGYLNQQGILKTDMLQRHSAAISLSPHLLDDHLRIDINATGAIATPRFGNQSAIGNAVTFDPTQSPYKKGSPYGDYFEWESSTGIPNVNSNRNPVALLNQKKDVASVKRLFGNAVIDYKLHFFPDLHANLNLGLDKADGSGNINEPGNAAQAWTTTSNHGYNTQYKTSLDYRVLEFKLDYSKSIPSIRSTVSAMAGYGYYDNKITTNNYAHFDSKGDTIPASAPLYPFGIQQNTLLSYFGRVIYEFADKYILTASLRTDGSSRFAPNDRWGTFPAVALAWRINQENFLKNVNILSDLKVRASYGIVGNQDGIGNYSYLPTYSLSQNGSQYEFGNAYYYMYTPAPFVANLQWEQTASTDIGLDFGLFGNRITGTMDYYYKDITKLQNLVFIPDATNFSNQATINIGDMISKGFEFNLNTTPVKTPNLTWDVNFNFTYEDIKVKQLTNGGNQPGFFGDAAGNISGGTGNTIQMQTVGYTPFSFFVLQQVYDPKSGMPIEGLYVDRNRDGQISPPPSSPDAYHYKSPFAPYILGFSTGVKIKSWEFKTVLRANFGNYVYNNVAANVAVQRSILNPSNFLENTLTSYTKSNFINNQYFSDFYVENGSFVKMDNLSVNYYVGKIWDGKARLNLNLNCQNVFVITKYSGLDPEIYGGIDNNIYPRPRTYTLGVNIGF